VSLGGAITAAVNESVPTALFIFFEQLPWSSMTSLVATLLVVTFFVTSSDSGSLVIDMITSGGMANP
ncbi:MAG: BCCT family transporter, partial [Gammaproteobacteria bacterium]|nr:BCCT family transporter [Gammaproteobacteria bacterium]